MDWQIFIWFATFLLSAGLFVFSDIDFLDIKSVFFDNDLSLGDLFFVVGWFWVYVTGYVLAVLYLISILKWRMWQIFRTTNSKTPEVAVVVSYQDLRRIKGWTQPSNSPKVIKYLEKLFKKEKKTYAFYRGITYKKFKNIMANKKIKEIYLLGHGDNCAFELGTDIEAVYFSDFDDAQKYGKGRIHHLHCGLKGGKSLVDYLVKKENRKHCFVPRIPIQEKDIIKYLKGRLGLLPKKSKGKKSGKNKSNTKKK